MQNKRTQSRAAFTAKVALAAIRSKRTMATLALSSGFLGRWIWVRFSCWAGGDGGQLVERDEEGVG